MIMSFRGGPLKHERSPKAPQLREGVNKTRNTEHLGTSWNISEHEKIKIFFMKNN